MPTSFANETIGACCCNRETGNRSMRATVSRYRGAVNQLQRPGTARMVVPPPG